MAAKSILTAARLREILHYDPDTGIFRWKTDWNSRARAGQIAGSPHHMRPGYVRWRIHIDKEYKAHRLAWLYMAGEWPAGLVDHRNRDPMDNRWSNLRIATPAQNQWNVGLRRDNKTGFTGIQYDKKRNKWRAEIVIHFGRFDTREEAHVAYRRGVLALRSEIMETTAGPQAKRVATANLQGAWLLAG